MLGILKIKLPDDFKKGDCDNCELSVHEWMEYTTECVLTGCDSDNCPLEMPEDIPMEYFENGGI